MKNKNLWIIGIVIVLIIVTVLIYINKKPDEKKHLEAGVIIPLTGSVAQPGEDFFNGMMLAKEEINSSVILYIEDSQSNGKDGVNAAKKLLDTKNIDIIVSIQSAVVVPILNLADEYNKPLLSSLISQDEFTRKSKNAFRFFQPARKNSALAADFANKYGFKNVSILVINDEYGKSMKDYFKKNFNGTILHEESFESGEQDFRTILSKTSDSEALYFLGYNPHYINLFKQRKELGKKIVFISNENMASNYMKSQVGDLYNNFYATTPATTVYNNRTKKFIDSFNKKYGHAPDWMAPFGYDMMLILDALDKSSKKPGESLYEININGLNGNISFDKDREINLSTIIVKPVNKSLIEVKF